ncbi:FTSH10 [Symbiodinium sp. CCMP2592]|nr:FTSH10 [Symbiodinium sp. CCMP2592]
MALALWTGGSSQNGYNEVQKINRRVTWLNSNVFPDRQIDQEAIGALCHLGAARSMEMLKEMEEKADQIKTPSNYIKAAAGREAAPAAASQSNDPAKIHRRATWLSTNVFQDRPIDQEAVIAMKSLETRRALELFKEIEEKKDQIKNPSRWLISAVSREASGGPYPEQTRARALPMPAVYAPPARAMHGPAGAGMSSADDTKIHRRASWLNGNVFPDRPIDEEAIVAMKSLGGARAMELFKEVEEKFEQIRNPSSYLKTAAARENPSGQGRGMPQTALALAPFTRRPDPATKIQRRASWLNGNVFPDRHIDPEAIEAMKTLDSARAMELFKEIEEKSGQVKNPSSYLKTAVAREGSGMPQNLTAAPRVGTVARLSGPASPEEQTKIHRRVTWMNANVFPDRKIDDEAIGAMYGLGLARAMELLQEIQEKSDSMRNPANWLKAAASREGLAPPPQSMAPAPMSFQAGNAKGGQTSDYSNYDKLHRRIKWLNNNVFVHSPLDAETTEALASLSLQRALEMLKELENKGSEVKNPSGYMKAAVSREQTG